MGEKIIAGKTVQVSDDGYMTNMDEWTPEIGQEIAKEENIELTDKHMEIINFIRDKVKAGDTLTIRSVGKSGIIDIKGFYGLFPGAPLKKAARIAGVKKPASCV